MLTSLYITPETYPLYTEIMEDAKRIPLELEEVANYFMLVDDSVPLPPSIWFMTAESYETKYEIVQPENETEFAIVTPR
jgi:hypothetical protein